MGRSHGVGTMNVNDKLLDSMKTLTTQALTLILALVVVSVYLLQRAAEAAFGTLDVLAVHYQRAVWGFGFSYFTLSFVWPLILAALGIACTAVMLKLRMTWERLKKNLADSPTEDVEALRPLVFTPFGSGAPRSWWTVAGLLPLIAVAVHVGSIGLAFFLKYEFYTR